MRLVRAFVGGICLVLALYGCGGSTESDSGSGGSSATGGGAVGGSSGSGAGGGAGGTSGTGAVSGSGGVAGAYGFAGECKVDADCQLVNDCCNCMGIPVGATAPNCPPDPCLVGTCTPVGATAARCIAGQCTAAIDCDPTHAQCFGIAPECAPGMLPSIVNQCWGLCVPATQCNDVGTCFDCGPGQACVVMDGDGSSQHHCVGSPPSCGSSSGCACFADKSCLSPFDACQDGIKDGSAVHCGCPAC
jgi:hypothetical protein